MAFSRFNRGANQDKNDDGGGTDADYRSDLRLRQSRDADAIDRKFGFNRINGNFGRQEVGYLINMHSTEILDDDKRLISAVDYYFIQEDGSRFKVSMPFRPYLYILVKPETMQETTAHLGKKYSGLILNMETVKKEDLSLANHLVGLKQTFLKLSFLNTSDLVKVRKDLLSAVRRNKDRKQCASVYAEMMADSLQETASIKSNPLDNLLDIREYDVPFHMRVSIDLKIFVGCWYSVQCMGNSEPPLIEKREDLITQPDCIVLAFDIETTKLPLKFPDSAIDQIMMISYMIDGQGYLITNREIISTDVEDFEYTPRPDFEGHFIIFNEPNEANLIQKFFDHILDVKPHIFVTYNGDFFDWSFIEARASFHGLNMEKEIGFSRNREQTYTSRPACHMDAYCWVKRDSYLPMGSQNLKAAAKAKLRYNPVELDPEDMCRMAAEQPQELANYSVSDAVATYYLYMKYVHPFCFALCTIIPMEPEEVLRKGSGTLCESLLCVEAFHANIIFPNKHETVLNKVTESGQVLDSETYVGGHVEAIESGVFRADIPCRFRLVPEAFQKLHDDVERCMRRAVEVEEGIPLEQVTNFDAVVSDIKQKLCDLRDTPARLENPIIYHLDVGAMYPNIILTNRLQPSAIVNETDCAACDFNKPNAQCQRTMPWMWRGEIMPASRAEYQLITQQLESEKFPPQFPGGSQRAFHELTKEERAQIEKKRLADYCRKAYKKTHVTKMEERLTTICQKENSFYVDTVRAFRDRRYTYKGLGKMAKKEVNDAQASGDAAWLKAAKNKEVLYDSLQLAHKCILNSFYGYVMRKGARWYSIEMAGIVCYTGAGIIKRARELVEQVGRPLELDTDGIWCVLPASFPENFVITTTNAKKPKVTISYVGAVLNIIVQDHYTNDQYHDLIDADKLLYQQRKENSIFFEVDGPYLAMILPASKEEGKKLKKRYAVFNFDGSLAELKGFEVKRRGELQIIKIFQSTVFEAFLKGDSLLTCYQSVARVADYWLDVLYSKGANMPDTELFELIAENKSMSKTLAEYEGQKSTSISTAKRLAEFLGDQMVKDAGLSCRFIISKKPEGAPVTERAIPLAIFESELSVKKHYLRKWLKDSSLCDYDIRQVLDWDYYIERLGGTIQKIITIPAALQGIMNPVPRVRHPDWLHKQVMEKTDILKQRKISEMFSTAPKKQAEEMDIEDRCKPAHLLGTGAPVPVVHTLKRKQTDLRNNEQDLSKSWREVLGNPPDKSQLREWIQFQKEKWKYQAKQKAHFSSKPAKKCKKMSADSDDENERDQNAVEPLGGVIRTGLRGTLDGFLRKAQRTLLDTPWQVIQIMESSQPGIFRVWAMVGSDLHCIKLVVPRVFYVNQKQPKPAGEAGGLWRKMQKLLPRSHPCLNLYEYQVPEELYRTHANELITDLATPDIEGIYETQVGLEFRALLELGCLWMVDRNQARSLAHEEGLDTFEMNWLSMKPTSKLNYLPDSSLKSIFFYHHKTGYKMMFGVFLVAAKKSFIFVVDTVKSNQMPNLVNMYHSERKKGLSSIRPESVPEADYTFDVSLEVSVKSVFRAVQKILTGYKNEKRGPTAVVVQSGYDLPSLLSHVPALSEFPVVRVHEYDQDSLYSVLDWQRIGAKAMLRHFIHYQSRLQTCLDQSRFYQIPVGNLPEDPFIYSTDMLFARLLRKNNFVLWASASSKPDLGGKEADDSWLMTEVEDTTTSTAINAPNVLRTFCVEIEVDNLAVNTLLQSHRINELEGTSSNVAFDAAPQASLEEMLGGQGSSSMALYDDTAAASPAFRVMKSMVAKLVKQVVEMRNIHADYLLIHFYRWLRFDRKVTVHRFRLAKSTHSLLYDPALRKTLLNLMKKLLMQLMLEFKRLGSIIIYADFNRIVLCTKKRCLEDALSYFNYISSTIKGRDLFHHLDLNVNKAWSFLMWLDAFNYGGSQCKLPSESSKNETNEDLEDSSAIIDDDDDEDDDGQCKIDLNWNIARYLPEAGSCQKKFLALMAGYIQMNAHFLKAELEKVAAGSTPVRRRRGSQSQAESSQRNPASEQQQGESAELASQKAIEGDLAHKLFSTVQDINHKYPEHLGKDEDEESVFPVLPGSHLTLTHPALEFIKALCKVLSLDTAVSDQVFRLRRNLLRLIGVGEFSPKAEWRDPCISFILVDMICKKCNHCRDIDLCRDTCVVVDESSFLPVLTCSSSGCRAPYDTKLMEHYLIDTVQRKFMSYMLQDVQCLKCRQIKLPNMAKRCSCAGNFTTLMASRDLDQLLKTFQSLATYYKMPLLQQVIQWHHSLQ